ncbi:protein disulfide-isomerase-like protein of the testis [Cynocephalus volans]|uniref:protein disulfide-isomerase-like protein of the testis n=1 Tax=Cynocephalus volans TaxID=110931 RepID=UPI002FCB05CF
MEMLWTPLLLVASCVHAVHSSPEVDASVPSFNISQPLHILEERNLLVLTPAGLTQMLNQTRFLMVLFHNPSSKQSRNMAAELGKAMGIMGKGKNRLSFGKVDITMEKELQQEFEVKKAPQLKLFFEGNRLEPISCKGVVESTALVVWLRRQIGQKAFLFNNSQQVVEFVKSRPLVIIGFFQDLEEEVAELFYDMIKDFPELTFGVIAIGNSIGRFHVTLDSVLVFKKGKIVKWQELLNDSTNKYDLNRVIKQHLTDFVIEYNSENKDLIYELHILNHMLLFFSKGSESYGPIIRPYKLASKEFQNKKHQSSEEIPKYWEQGLVKQLVGENFNVVIFDKERDVFVMFYAPWSEKCTALFPVLEELGRKYQNHSTVTIAKINIMANNIQLMFLDQYLFFRLFSTDSQQAVPYKGEHTIKGFSDFLESQVKTRDTDEGELLSVEQHEVIEEEVLAEEEEAPFTEKELPRQRLPELENVTQLGESAVQKETAEKKVVVAEPKGPPKPGKKPKVKEEL